MSRRHEEYHVTVAGDPVRWVRFCGEVNIKPLWIELNNFERQLMCAASFNPASLILREGGFRIVRVKHELSSLDGVQAHPHYWECHVKLDGTFAYELPMASRDLLRDTRWYCTLRKAEPFDYMRFLEWVARHTDPRTTMAGYEYEVCVHDSRPELDASWLEYAQTCEWLHRRGYHTL